MANENSSNAVPAAMLQHVLVEVRDNSIALASFNADLRNIKEQLDAMNKLVRDGNGQPSLLTKMTIAENTISDIDEDVKQLKAHFELSKQEVKEEKTEITIRKAGWLKFYGTIIAAILALVASLLTLIFK